MQDKTVKIQQIIKGKKVLFVSHKTADYIRNSQELRLIKESAKEFHIITADAKLTWLKYFVSIVKVFFRLLLVGIKKYDVVFLGYLPQFIIPVLHPLFRKKVLISDFYISLFDTLVHDKKLLAVGNPLAKMVKLIDVKTIQKSDHLIVDTLIHGEYFIEEFNAEPDKIIVLHIEADRSIYFPHFIERAHDLKNKFVVLYFGTLLPLQGADVILHAIDLLKEESNIRFIFIGPIKGELKEKYYSLPNTKFIEWVSQTKLADYIAQADLCLAGHFHGNIEKAKRVIPGKAMIYRAMNKPMILGENKANRECFSEGNGVFFVEMGSAEALAGLIKKICGQKQ